MIFIKPLLKGLYLIKYFILETMTNPKKIIIGLLGAIFILFGLYYHVLEPDKSNISYEAIGIGTWLAGLLYFGFFPKYKEVITLILGIIVLHTGVILLLVERFSHPKLIGILAFISGIVVVLNSGFSDYLKRRKK